ncbi:MAG: mechanosensitive ion channel [Acidobacteria bacterium]|nr:mechanosensitive ion channel [Acidobacteriota bacterium]
MVFFQAPTPTPSLLNGATQIGDVVWDSINHMLTSIVGRLPQLIAGIVVAFIFFLLARGVKAIFLATSSRTRLDGRLRTLFSRLITVAIIVLGIFTALTVVVPTFGLGDLIAGLGFTTFVVGFATKDILNNLLSGVLILWQQPFKIGDQIFIDKINGKVEYIGVRATSLRQDNGEVVIIPNGDMYSRTLVIRGAGDLRRMNLDFKVGYSEDLEKTKEGVKRALERTEAVVKKPAPFVLVTDFASDGISINVAFWIDTNKVIAREALDAAATNIINSLNKRGVEAYPPGSVVVLSPSEATPQNGVPEETANAQVN